MKKRILRGIIATFLIAIAVKTSGQEVYHFPKEENFQVYGDCFNELRAIKDKAEERTLQYEADAADYKKGRFCSDCKRSATRIEREDHISFTQHIADGESHGRKPIPATKGMYDTLYMNYRADWDPQKKAYDAKFIDCQGKVKISNDELNTTISNYDAKYNDALAQLNKIQNPQKKAELQASITQNRTAFLQYKQQAQQQLTSRDGDGMAQTLQNLQQQADNMNTIDTDASVAARNVKIPDVKSNQVKGEPRSPAAGNRAEVTTPKSESVAITNSGVNSSTQRTQRLVQQKNEKLQDFNSKVNIVATQLQTALQEKFEREQVERDARYAAQKQEREEKYEADSIAQARKWAKLDEEDKRKWDEHRSESNNSFEIGIGAGLFKKPSEADIDSPNLKALYYIAYFRKDNSAWIMKPMKIDKYSDDSWISPESLQKKINALFPDTYNAVANESELHIVGYMVTQQSAIVSYNVLVQNCKKAGCTITEIVASN